MAVQLLAWVGARGAWILAASIFVGLALPQLAELVRPLFPVSVFCLLTIAMVRIDTGDALKEARTSRSMILGIAWAMLAVPVLFWIAFSIAKPGPEYALALILLATAPSTVSSPAMSQLLGLNGTLSLAVLLLGMIITPLTVPALTEFILDIELDITIGQLALRLAFLIGGAAIAAWAVRRLLGDARRVSSDLVFDGLNVAFMVLFAVAAMDGVADALWRDPRTILGLTGAAFALNLGLLALTAAIFWRLGASTALTLGFSAGNRNMALAISALATAVPPDTWIFFALVQFPIYITPLLLRPVMRRLLAT